MALVTAFVCLGRLVRGRRGTRKLTTAVAIPVFNEDPFAPYRAEMVRVGLDAYLNETFFGRPVQFSDDSLLTFYALLAAKTVQVPTATGFTAMPETMSHHVRQYLRCMRGMTIRTVWRFRYLPQNRYEYWQHRLAGCRRSPPCRCSSRS